MRDEMLRLYEMVEELKVSTEKLQSLVDKLTEGLTFYTVQTDEGNRAREILKLVQK